MLQGGGCTARYVANALGLPPDTPGGAVQRQCATGMMAVQEAAANIRSGMADVVVAGGVESMTRGPVLFEKSPFPFGGVERFMPPEPPEHARRAEHEHAHHGRREHGPRVRHHPRGVRRLVVPLATCGPSAATDDGRFAEEIVPVTVPAGRGETVTVSVDEHPRPDTTPEKLAALPSLTGPDGQVTAGNSSGIADGGAALVVVVAAYAEAHGHGAAGDGAVVELLRHRAGPHRAGADGLRARGPWTGPG